ncbi:MAG: hypothetical protein G4V63_30545, partial [Candidatus Afipia apatlaquensis]|nr:hypothetical protein [Candidatus Afipia apatlaquensis]
MPTLNIGGRTVNVGDDFLKLSPKEQNAAVDEIAKSLMASSGGKNPPSDEDAARSKLRQGLREGRNGDLETYRAASFRTNQGVRPANATDAAVNGATAGFADEISAAARAPIDMALRGEGYDEAYQHNLAAERDRLDQYRKNSPVASTAAEVAGGLAFPVGGAGPIRAGLTT